MADEEALKRIEARLTRLEAAIAQGIQGGTGPTNVAAPGGTIVDPPPWGGGGWMPWRPIPITTPIVNPIADPAPWGGWGGGRPPVLTHPIGTIADPAPWATPFSRQQFLPSHIGTIADPAPPDLGRFTLAQLESSLHSIAAERARLDATEGMIKERIAAMKKEGQQGS